MRPLSANPWWLFAALLSVQAGAVESIVTVSNRSSKAVQAAIDAAAAQGGGVAYLPPGRYVSGPLWLKDNVELRLDAGATLVLRDVSNLTLEDFRGEAGQTNAPAIFKEHVTEADKP